jgi:NTP pyrophosphatase (non-canonical NTP hydrolase)
MWSDGTTTIAEMRAAVAAFIDERGWGRYHAPVNVASAAVVEAAELLEVFQWRRPGDALPEDAVIAAGSELADTLHFTLCMANALDGTLEIDDMTVGEVCEGASVPEGGAKAAAEDVLVDSSLLLMAARAAFGPGGARGSGDAETVDALTVTVELVVSALGRCAHEMGLDLSRELELKDRLNRQRFPIGMMPDVGY